LILWLVERQRRAADAVLKRLLRNEERLKDIENVERKLDVVKRRTKRIQHDIRIIEKEVDIYRASRP
jgi:hypothetical protein